ncbi:MAG: M48 family metalloprotease [Proteobacteria bacterium]|nr:M48 family metalloprotease [Pseudomonadota bacterium]
MSRRFITVLTLLILIVICVFVSVKQLATPKTRTYESIFQIFGKPFKTFDRALTKVSGVSDEDEKQLGNYLLSNISQDSKINPKIVKYIQSLVDKMAANYNPKGLTWRVFVYNGEPNAYALPGGIIHISVGLLEILDSEDEIIAILAHEKGHIDLGHCIDSYRNMVKTFNRSAGTPPILSIFNFFLRIQHSKYSENEADNYAFETLTQLNYCPLALGTSFEKLEKIDECSKKGKLLSDYFKSHPSSNIRSENWLEVGKRYIKNHPKADVSPNTEHWSVLKKKIRFH